MTLCRGAKGKGLLLCVRSVESESWGRWEGRQGGRWMAVHRERNREMTEGGWQGEGREKSRNEL